MKDLTIAILILAILFIGFSFTHYSKAIEECAGKGGVYVRTVHGHQCMKANVWKHYMKGLNEPKEEK